METARQVAAFRRVYEELHAAVPLSAIPWNASGELVTTWEGEGGTNEFFVAYVNAGSEVTVLPPHFRSKREADTFALKLTRLEASIKEQT